MQTVHCPKCNHQQPARLVRCLYCGESLSASSTASARTCPVCKRAMAAVPAGWVLIDRCDGCQGEYYDTGELERVKTIGDADAKWIRESTLDRKPAMIEAERACPGCSTRMESVLAAYEVTIDVCPKCRGVWCDKGEADRLRTLAMSRNEASVMPADIVQEVDDVAWTVRLATDLMFDANDGGDRAYHRLRRAARGAAHDASARDDFERELDQDERNRAVSRSSPGGPQRPPKATGWDADPIPPDWQTPSKPGKPRGR